MLDLPLLHRRNNTVPRVLAWFVVWGTVLFAVLYFPPLEQWPPEIASLLRPALAGAASLGLLLALLRWAQYAWYSVLPEDLDKLATELHAKQDWKRRRALQALADFYGHPFGKVACWPFQTHSASQLETMAAAYQKWWLTARKSQDNLIWFRELGKWYGKVTRRFHLPPNAHPEVREVTGEGLPPLPRQKFVEGLRPRMEEVLNRAADLIDKAPSGAILARSEGKIYTLFQGLAWDALLFGLDLRTGVGDAAQGRPQAAPASGDQLTPMPTTGNRWRPQYAEGLGAKFEQLVEQFAEAVRDAVLDLGDDPADRAAEVSGAAPLAPLPTESFVTALHGKVEDTIRRVAEAINGSPSGRIEEATQQRVFDLLTDLGCDALELGLHLRVAAQEAQLPSDQLSGGAWASKFRRMKAAEGRWPPRQSASSDERN